MGTACLEMGTVVQIRGNEHRLHRKIEDCWQLEEAKTGRFVEHDQLSLLQMVADKTLTFPGSFPRRQCAPLDSEVPTPGLELAKVRRSYVQAVLKMPNTPKRVEKAIHEVWERIKLPQKPPSRTSVYMWFSRFQKSNGDIRSLVDDTRSKGNRESRYPAEVIEFCQQAIASRYLKRERNGIQETLEDAIYRVKMENALRPECDRLSLPTRRLITRMIESIPAFDKCVAREGHDAAIRKFRWVKGHVVTDEPLDRAEIDHTQLDLMVVDEVHRVALGRPWITACMDCYTRCILGIYIGFTPPSYQSVAACLKNCFEPKVNLRQDYPEIVNEWPAYGVMRNLVVDGGREFYSESLESVCLQMNINWVAAPRRMSWFKGMIERFMGTMNRAVAHRVPGTTFSNIFEKGDYDPAKEASISLSAFKSIFYKWLVDVYHQQPHRTLQTTPAKKWVSSITPERIPLPDESIQLNEIMGRVYKDRLLSHKGIEFYDLYYNSADLAVLRGKDGENLKVDIRVDESNLGTIRVIDPKSSKHYSVPALDFEYANSVSFWLHKVLRNRQRKKDNADQNPEGWMKAKAEIRSTIAEELKLKRRSTSKRKGRFNEALELASAKSSARKATLVRNDISGSAFEEEIGMDAGRSGSTMLADSDSNDSDWPVFEPIEKGS